jgi:hypothetical protein
MAWARSQGSEARPCALSGEDGAEGQLAMASPSSAS